MPPPPIFRVGHLMPAQEEALARAIAAAFDLDL